MKLYKPPKIIYHIQGYVSEAEQKKIRNEAQRQVGLLRSGMAFQGLSQGRRIGQAMGLKFMCTSVFDLESVHISLEKRVSKDVAKPERLYCWCIYQFSHGIILEVIPKDTGNDLCLPTRNIRYPWCADPSNGGLYANFAGIRYLVEVCQKKFLETYVCIGTDYETYSVNDNVIVLYIDSWEEESESACTVPPKDVGASELDGQFVIMPYAIPELDGE